MSEAALALLVGSEVAYRFGRLAEALDQALESAELCARSHAVDLAAAAAAAAARVRLERGETDSARALLEAMPSPGAHPLVYVVHTSVPTLPVVGARSRRAPLRAYPRA